MNQPSDTLVFLFEVRKTKWNPLKGFKAPTDAPIFEARALPSRRSALGDSVEEAVANLDELLTRELTYTTDALAWYRRQLESLDEAKLRSIGADSFLALRNQLRSHYLSTPSVEARVFVKETDEASSSGQSLCMSAD